LGERTPAGKMELLVRGQKGGEEELLNPMLGRIENRTLGKKKYFRRGGKRKGAA